MMKWPDIFEYRLYVQTGPITKISPAHKWGSIRRNTINRKHGKDRIKRTIQKTSTRTRRLPSEISLQTETTIALPVERKYGGNAPRASTPSRHKQGFEMEINTFP